ncbi:MAG: nitrogenase component 1 [Eubacteriales bacterium]|nr:nitrogenase component 1 [Eubacteriales bacterium]
MRENLGDKYLAKARRLSEVNEIYEVTSLSEALFPGSHCPLFGALLAIRQIKGAAVLIVGSDECTYYAKIMAMQSKEFGEQAEFCYSLVLEEQDVSFGCQEKLTKAVKEIHSSSHFEVIFVVTTCLVELIGDDLESVCWQLEDELNIDLPLVHTEHFKCENHLPGLERVLESCAQLMREPESPMQSTGKRINLLGHRHGDFDSSELAEFLRRAGIDTHLVLPSEATIAQLRDAAQVEMNLVTDVIGLPLAKAMKTKFDIPYLYFDRFVTPETIAETYDKLLDRLVTGADEGLRAELEKWLVQRLAEVKEKESRLREKLVGTSFIYGNTPLLPLEFIAYLTELGLLPKLVQLSRFSDEDLIYKERILKKADPYVTKNANIAPLQSIYDILQPSFYFGHEFAARLRQKGIILMAMDRLGKFYGYQLTENLLDYLTEGLEARAKLLAEQESAGAMDGEVMMAAMAGMGHPSGQASGHPGAMPQAKKPAGHPGGHPGGYPGRSPHGMEIKESKELTGVRLASVRSKKED